MPESAIVLLSGGMDSAVAAALARSQGFALYALSFRYGQRHLREIEAAKRVAQSLPVEKHLILDIPLGQIGGSALLKPAADFRGAGAPTRTPPVPKDRTDSEISAGIPPTYVPARNTIFLAYALAWAEVIPARHIFLGVNARDYSGYPDCRPEFVAAFEQLANLATKAGVEGEKITLHAPLIHLRKAEIVRKGIELGVEFSLTHSCYDPAPDGRACGRCDSCSLRRKGFREAGVPDPILYLG
jgi:7-cyano-7-deazaguanine synthase